MKLMKYISSLLLIFTLLLCEFIGCTLSGDIAGTGSQAGNGNVLGTVVNPDGSPSVNADVFIRPKEFLKDTTEITGPTLPDAVTDSTGAFVIDTVEPGEYFVEINDGVKNAILVECVKDSVNIQAKDLGTIYLKPQAGFFGVVIRENIPNDVHVYVQVYGLDHAREVKLYGDFSFYQIPAGTYNLRISSSDSTLGTVDSETITIDPAEELDAGTFILPFEYWRDTLVVREILDSNDHTDIPVAEVTTEKNGRVGELDLTNMDISTIPPSIGNLRITHLFLRENSISSLPDEIGKIASLEYLNVAINDLPGLPPTIGNCTRLKHLDASDNHLSGSNIPFEIGKLTSLTYLGLQRNTIRRPPPSLGDLIQLKVLDLGYNQIDRLPFQITALTNLDFLSVNYNRLVHVPDEIEAWIDTYSFDEEWRTTQISFHEREKK